MAGIPNLTPNLRLLNYYLFIIHCWNAMNIIEIIEITPIVAKRIGCSIPTKGKLRIPAIIAMQPITKVVNLAKLFSLISSFDESYNLLGSVTIIKPIPMIINQRNVEYSNNDIWKKLCNIISTNPTIDIIAKTLENLESFFSFFIWMSFLEIFLLLFILQITSMKCSSFIRFCTFNRFF